MIDLVALTKIVQSPRAAQVLAVTKIAIYSLTRTFVIVRSDFSDEWVEMPTELRVVVPLQTPDALLRIEVTILSATMYVMGVYDAEFALRVIDDPDHNVTLDDYTRLLAGIEYLFPGATEFRPNGYEDSLCFQLPPHDLDD